MHKTSGRGGIADEVVSAGRTHGAIDVVGVVAAGQPNHIAGEDRVVQDLDFVTRPVPKSPAGARSVRVGSRPVSEDRGVGDVERPLVPDAAAVTLRRVAGNRAVDDIERRVIVLDRSAFAARGVPRKRGVKDLENGLGFGAGLAKAGIIDGSAVEA